MFYNASIANAQRCANTWGDGKPMQAVGSLSVAEQLPTVKEDGGNFSHEQ